ncbi:MAG: acetate--CoA ligase family protein [Anaerolineales bacterium]|nr:acetate--CoA ligase family protein [Anaerolineales bacterium]
MSSLTPLLHPRSVAVIGATERADASSSFVMRNLMQHGYAGQIYPVHPRAETVFGLTAVPTITHLPQPPDLAVICIAAPYVAAALEEAGRKGTKAAIVLSSGFAEKDAEGRARQQELVEIAAKYDMAVCGPNCLGLIAHQANTVLYSSRFPMGVPKGDVALISQSGAIAIALSSTGCIGFSHIISSGNSAVTDIPDYLRYLAADPLTRVVMLVLENISRPEALAAAMQEMHKADKRVVALYVGRTERGAAATSAHTGALAGSFAAVQAFFRRHGIVSVESMDELLQTTAVLSVLPQRPQKRGLAIIGVSGGGVAHVSDVASAVGLTIPPLQPETIAQLKAILPPFITPQNPLDTTGLPFSDGDVYRQALDFLANDPAIGLITAVQDAPPGLDEAGTREYLPIAQGIVDFAHTAPVPVVVVSNLADGHHPLFSEPLRQAGVPMLRGTAVALKAINHLFTPMPMAARTAQTDLAMDAFWQKRFANGAPFTEREAKQLLAAYGIRTTREELATSAAEAVQLAAAIGFPVVMKIESPDITHKSDVGGVLLGVGDETAVEQAYDQLMANVSKAMPQAKLHGVVVQEMVVAGVEAFVGVSRYAPFGFGVVVGPGGVLVELVGETAVDLLPLNPESAQTLVESTRLNKLLSGFRGSPPADRSALVDTILKLAQIVQLYGDYLDTIELNPITVLPEGQGICVLDAVMLPAKSSITQEVQLLRRS